MSESLCPICERPSTNFCGGCKLVSYCGKEHQRSHWKAEHKSECKPLFRVDESAALGRHLVATRDVKRGELILKEAPLVLGPKAVSRAVCLGCLLPCEPGKWVDCGGCGFPLCSIECQASEQHADECRLMSERSFKANVRPGEKSASYFPIVPLRCLLIREKNPEKYKKIANLESHLVDKLGGPLFAVYKTNVVDFLRDRLGLGRFDEVAILTVAGILDTNAFEVRRGGAALRGLYNSASMMAHNCRPNTKHTFDGSFTLSVIATEDIPAGGVIYATYTQTLWGTLARRSHLRMAKCFECTCERCSDPTELGTFVGAIRCTRCVTPDNFTNGPYITSTNPLDDKAPWRCDNCQHSIVAKQIACGNESLREEISRLNKRKAEDLEEFMETYGVYGAGVLHPRNSHAVQVKHALVQIYGNAPGYLYSDVSDEVLERKLDYCHELLDLVDVLEPGHSKIRGELLCELQATMVVQAKRRCDEGKITEAAAEKTLKDAAVIFKEAYEILKVEPAELRQRVESLAQELGVDWKET